MAENTALPLTTPFKNIALALSGGGFRAASFSLGTLSYLQHLKLETDEVGNSCSDSLLDQVSFISSASGGTITAAFYSMWRNKGESFGSIYKKLLASLNGEKLLQKAMGKLNDEKEWSRPDNLKKRNFINAFAKAYDEDLFSGEKFGIFADGKSEKDFEVCFNATEFQRGLSFRFQTDHLSSTTEKTGNRFIYFNTRDSDIYKDIKIADILAASSCFPSGFEPILFPEDFTYSEEGKVISADDLRQSLLIEDYERKINSLPQDASISLMDGGITDNQGLQSAMNADLLRRKHNKKEFDLIIVTDVTSYFIDAYQYPKERKASSWEKKTIGDLLKKVVMISRSFNFVFAGALLLTLAGVSFIFFGRNDPTRYSGYLLLGFFGCLSILSGILIYLRKRSGLTAILSRKLKLKEYLKKKIPGLKNFSSSLLDKLILFLKNVRLDVLQQLIAARISSVTAMASDINLKQVRRLIYDEFYDNPRWEGRRCLNFIYELSRKNDASRKKDISDYVHNKKLSEPDFLLLQASSKITDIAEKARMVGTTLWFGSGQEEQLKEVVSCGQFSACVNLLQYVLMLENDASLQFSEPVKKMLLNIKGKLVADWKQFNEDPCFLFEFYQK